MALLKPNEGSTSQGFGVSNLNVEPAMYHLGNTKAWWQPTYGWSFSNDFHAAIDIAAPAGTPIVASESGLVTESYFDSINGGGNKIVIQIRPGIFYCSNHMSRRLVKEGDKVSRGQKIGEVGTTGASTGNHNHFWVGISEPPGDDTWPVLYNPTLFLSGGSMSDDPRIKPINQKRYIRVNGPGINIRTWPSFDPAKVWATTLEGGIYRKGEKISGLNKKMVFKGWYKGPDYAGSDLWAKAWFRSPRARRNIFISKPLIHFVD